MLNLLLAYLFFTSTLATEIVVVGAVSASDDSLTAIDWGITATSTGFAAVGVKSEITKDPTSNQGILNVSAELDARKISLSTPGPLNNQNLGFYYGALDIAAQAQWTTTSVQASVSSALAELGVAFQSIFVYYNRDAVAGFQWNSLDDAVFNCSNSETYDCIDATGVIRLKEDLEWGNLIYQPPQDCPQPDQNTVAYTNSCKVYTAEVSGYVKGTNMGTHVVTITFHLANQPVLVNDINLPTGYGKIDINITYPWDSQTLTGSQGNNPKIGLSLLAAGKVVIGQFEGVAVVINGEKGYKWGGSAYATTWTVADSATIDGNNGQQVYYGSFTGAEIIAHTCGGIIQECLTSAGQCFVCGLQINAKIYAAFGWNTRILWYSWDNDKPNQVFWDPSMALDDSASSTPTTPDSPPPSVITTPDSIPTGSSTRSLVSLLLSVVVLVLALF